MLTSYLDRIILHHRNKTTKGNEMTKMTFEILPRTSRIDANLPFQLIVRRGEEIVMTKNYETKAMVKKFLKTIGL